MTSIEFLYDKKTFCMKRSRIIRIYQENGIWCHIVAKKKRKHILV